MQHPIQFDWRRHWKTKVRPYLDEELVQQCLDFGMRIGGPTWHRGDAPFEYWALDCRRDPRPGTLRWYQPGRRSWGRIRTTDESAYGPGSPEGPEARPHLEKGAWGREDSSRAGNGAQVRSSSPHAELIIRQRRVPHLHRSIHAAADDPLAIGTEGHANDFPPMPPEGEDFLTGGRIPHLYRP